jgi:hypothetical protein
MKTSVAAYDYRELHKKPKLKIIKHGYDRGCPKRPAIQIGLLEILGVKVSYLEKKGWPLEIVYNEKRP